MTTLTCLEVKRRLSPLLDDELPERSRRLVERHLGSCGPCSRERRQLAKLIAVLASTSAASAPPGFLDRLDLRLAVRRRQAARRAIRAGRLAAVAAGAATCLIAAPSMEWRSTPEPEVAPASTPAVVVDAEERPRSNARRTELARDTAPRSREPSSSPPEALEAVAAPPTPAFPLSAEAELGAALPQSEDDS